MTKNTYKLFVLLIIIVATSCTSTVKTTQPKANTQNHYGKMSTSKYIRLHKELAIAEMKKYKIPASITLAQGILESGSGNSTLARKANNHFGIKCHKGWHGKTFKWTDDAYNECFRRYNSVGDSYRDHSKFLSTRGRYSSLFKLKTTDYQGWARGLQRAGYATNKQYAALLIKVIEENKLYRYDDKKYQRMVLNGEDIAAEEVLITENAVPEPKVEDYKALDIPNIEREIYTNNGVKFIFAKEGDTFERIAKELNMYSWQLPKYNDLNKSADLKPGQMVYIQQKKNKASEKYHIVRKNESLHYISQLYAIKVEAIKEKNNLASNDTLRYGQQLKLR